MTCSYCGFVFEESGAGHQCQGCLIASGCHSVRCPRCSYEMPEEVGLLKRLAEWSKRIRKSSASRPADGTVNQSYRTISLAEMRPGQSGVVVDLRSGKSEVQKCLALGILPGASITLRKRAPSFIFDVGFSQFAVDEGLARAVLIKPDCG